jgi:ribonuclease PH
MNKERNDGRAFDQLRDIKISYDVFTFGVSSVLFELGNTKILCTISLQPGVPSFLRGKGAGWLTAEYSLLPNATHVRTVRESSNAHRNGRMVEISRFISRVLRTVADLKVLGEQTVYVDCDVLQADGGTRTASIIAASLALQRAQIRWLENRQISSLLINEAVAAVSVGVIKDQLLLDPDYSEDQKIEADFNLVITASNKLIEIQGGAEKAPLSWELFDNIKQLAIKGMSDLQLQLPTITVPTFVPFGEQKQNSSEIKKLPFFSLKNRHPSAAQP